MGQRRQRTRKPGKAPAGAPPSHQPAHCHEGSGARALLLAWGSHGDATRRLRQQLPQPRQAGPLQRRRRLRLSRMVGRGTKHCFPSTQRSRRRPRQRLWRRSRHWPEKFQCTGRKEAAQQTRNRLHVRIIISLHQLRTHLAARATVKASSAAVTEAGAAGAGPADVLSIREAT